MKVFVYPADLYGCGYYRVVWPAQAIQRLVPELDVTIVPPGDPSGIIAVQHPRTQTVMDVVTPPGAEVIVLQRPTLRQLAQAVPIMRARGITVIVDIDDDLNCISPSNPAWRAMHPSNGTEHSWRYVTEACKQATMATVSSEALTTRYGTVARFIPNCVPERFLEIEHTDSTLMGWAGSLHSHPDDLDVVGTAVKQVMDDGGRFLIVGNGLGAGRHLGTGWVDPDYTGPIPFHEWGSAVSQLGIGIAPLADTRFNAAKSWLKVLEYSAVGVPWVASPRAEYASFHSFGAGLLARRPRDWTRLLRQLVNDDDVRNDLSARGREVAAAWTIERNVHRWVEAWVEARKIDLRRRVSA